MSDILYDEVPSLDLADFNSGDEARRSKFVNDLGEAYNNIGFVAIKNHYLTEELSQKLYAAIQKFFSLSDDVKQKYEIDGLAGQRGYIGKGKEHAKGRKTGDLKEFFHIGQEVTDNDPIKEEYPDNVWVDEVPDLEAIGLEVYKRLEKTGVEMLRAIALYLGLEESYFDNKVKNGNSILRPIHYFPIDNPEAVPDDAVRAAEHGDINLITLLMGASADGLQVLRRDGKWIPITALPEQLVVNVGDMLERHTNKKLKSTIHRVVNPPKEQMKTSRYSIPFFMHPRSEMDLTCLENCVDSNHPKEFDDITAGQFLDQRLAEIGLKK
ncbi:isopenicillin N synthase family oxygenase [Fulvivirga sp. 29W222]|uniref:Isopenicillin N synthase family oxygenase n=1 Tax=Fulvivirga marina TaxID=2494733 RepID=A0A937FVH9_9BACT|nr:isopenicillin N synthase family oxygenase [Fulvivirga marina]MBL6446905.1 isopenicillin N synthase family oxygenase [Fulvivirga marina]